MPPISLDHLWYVSTPLICFCRAQRQDCVEAQIWGRLQNKFCCIEGSQEQRVLNGHSKPRLLPLAIHPPQMLLATNLLKTSIFIKFIFNYDSYLLNRTMLLNNVTAKCKWTFSWEIVCTGTAHLSRPGAGNSSPGGPVCMQVFISTNYSS